VDPQGRPEHTGPDVGDAGEVEHPLDGPVLAIGPVEDREHDVDLGPLPLLVDDGRLNRVAGQGDPGSLLAGDAGKLAPGPRRRWQLRQLMPAPPLVDPDQQDVVAAWIQRVHDRSGRGHRHLVLGGATSEDHHDTAFRSAAIWIAAHALSSAWSTSSTRSEASSPPTATRRRPSSIPASARSSAASCRWLVVAGWQTWERRLPNDEPTRTSLSASQARSHPSYPLRNVTASMAPNLPPSKSAAARAWSGCSGRPEYPTEATLGCAARARASSRAVAHCRSMRRTSVCIPRRASQASKAPAVVP